MSTETFALVGNAQAGTISTLRIAGDALERVTDSPVGNGCGTFAIDQARGLVYSAVKEPKPAVVTLQFNRSTGALTELRRREIPDSVTYLALTRDGSVLLGASYGGGWGVAWPVTDGELAAAPSRIDHANLHAVVPSSDGQFAYFVSLGDDLVAQVRVAADASLTPLDPPTVPVEKGAGARHLVLSADETHAYLLTEYTGEALRFDRDPLSGALTLAEAVVAHDTGKGLKRSRFGANPLDEHLIWGADLHLVKNDRFLVCTERTISTLAVVGVDAAGRLGALLSLTETEQQPRGFNVTPDGTQLVVVGEKSGHATLYAISDDGQLTAQDRVPTGAGANWVRFIH